MLKRLTSALARRWRTPARVGTSVDGYEISWYEDAVRDISDRYAMPIIYKLPAYAGNTLLALIGLIVMANNSAWTGILLAALAALNLFLVRKLDLFSREEAWLALELKKAKMREELLALETQLEGEKGSATPD